MTRVTGPDCAVMCNLIKYTHTCRVWSEVFIISIIDPSKERINASGIE